MRPQSILALLTLLLPAAASADPEPDKNRIAAREEPSKLSLFTSAGYLATSGGNGGALATGVRYAIGRHFALGFDLGYGLMATDAGMQDRWWFMPSMAVVVPARIGKRAATFDIGAGLGLGTSSGYASWSEYASHPFSADWEFQLEPAVRAHAIAALALTPSLEIFTRAEAAALVLPHGSSPNVTDSTWMMFSVGTRFGLL
jgi:hypothetical protein